MENKSEQNSRFLALTFQHIIDEMKGGPALWEDFFSKASKFNSSLKSFFGSWASVIPHESLTNTVSSSSAMWDAFQSIADSATNTRGSTKEIGAALTRLCLRQKSVEAKMKQLNEILGDRLIDGHQERLEEWKKRTSILDKEHTKDYKKVRSEIKKLKLEALKLTRKIKKDFDPGSNDSQSYLECRKRLEIVNSKLTEKLRFLEESETRSLRNVLAEEHNRLCTFVSSSLKPVMEAQIELMSEMTHVQEITDSLGMKTATEPELAFGAQWEWIEDLKAKVSQNLNGAPLGTATFAPNDFDDHILNIHSPRGSHSTADRSSSPCLSSPFSTFSTRSGSTRYTFSKSSPHSVPIQNGGAQLSSTPTKWRAPLVDLLNHGVSEDPTNSGFALLDSSHNLDETYVAIGDIAAPVNAQYSDVPENSLITVDSRLSSISSRDSGFNSQETPAATNPSPQSLISLPQPNIASTHGPTLETGPCSPKKFWSLSHATNPGTQFFNGTSSKLKPPKRLPICKVGDKCHNTTSEGCQRSDLKSPPQSDYASHNNACPVDEETTPIANVMGVADDGERVVKAMLSQLARSFNDDPTPVFDQTPAPSLANVLSDLSFDQKPPTEPNKCQLSMSGYNLKSWSGSQQMTRQYNDASSGILAPQASGQQPPPNQQRFTTCNGVWPLNYDNKKMNRNSWCNAGVGGEKCLPYNPFVLRSSNSFRRGGSHLGQERGSNSQSGGITIKSRLTSSHITTQPEEHSKNEDQSGRDHGYSNSSRGSDKTQKTGLSNRLKNILSNDNTRFPAPPWFKESTQKGHPSAMPPTKQQISSPREDVYGSGRQSNLSQPILIPNFNQAPPHQVMVTSAHDSSQPQHLPHYGQDGNILAQPWPHHCGQTSKQIYGTVSGHHPHNNNNGVGSGGIQDIPSPSSLLYHQTNGGSLRVYPGKKQAWPASTYYGSPMRQNTGYYTQKGSLSCHNSPTKLFIPSNSINNGQMYCPISRNPYEVLQASSQTLNNRF